MRVLKLSKIMDASCSAVFGNFESPSDATPDYSIVEKECFAGELFIRLTVLSALREATEPAESVAVASDEAEVAEFGIYLCLTWQWMTASLSTGSFILLPKPLSTNYAIAFPLGWLVGYKLQHAGSAFISVFWRYCIVLNTMFEIIVCVEFF